MPFITLDDKRIHYRDQGQGPVLVLISGYGADSAGWLQDMDFFSKYFRCLAFDHPGVSGSAPLPGELTTAIMADRIAAALRKMSIQKAMAIGVSMGGAVAQEMLLRHPNLIERCVITGSWRRLDAKSKSLIQALQGLHRSCDREAAYRAILPWIFSRYHYENNPDSIDILVQYSLDHPIEVDVLEKQMRACLSHDPGVRLKEISMPVLITYGDEDALIPPELAMELAKAIPTAKTYVFKGLGHCHLWEDPRAYQEVVLPFLRG